MFAGFGLAVSTKAKIKEKIKQVLQSKNMSKHTSPTSNIRRTSECTYTTPYWGGGFHFPTSDKTIALCGCNHNETSDSEGKGVTVSAKENLFSTSLALSR